MDHISCLQPIPDSQKSKMIRCWRNGDGKLTEIFVCQELFGDLKKGFQREDDWASIFLLYDLKTGWFWWRYTALTHDKSYFKNDIDTRLSRLGYWEENDGNYVYYNTVRNPKEVIYLSSNKIVSFSIKWATLYIKESQEQYDEFVQGYENTIFKITQRLEKGERVNERIKAVSLRIYIDDRFFRIPNFCGIAELGNVIGVKQKNDKWLIELAGVDWEESDRTTKALYIKDWLAEWREGYYKTKVTVILNENYEVVDILGEDFVKKTN